MPLAAAGAVLVWSGNWPVTRLTVAHVDPAVVGALRTLIAAAVAVPAILLRPVTWPATRTEWAALALGALGNFVAFPVLASLGLGETTAARGALIFAAAPVLTALLSAALLRERLSARRLAGLGLGLLAMAVLLAPGLRAGGGGWRGDALVLLATLSSSVYYVTGGYLGRRLGSWSVVALSLGLGALLLTPLALRAPGALRAAGPADWWGLAYLGLLGTLGANVAWIWAMARSSVIGVGAFQFLQPLPAVLVGVLVLGERLAWPAVAGGLGALYATYLLQDRGRRRPP